MYKTYMLPKQLLCQAVVSSQAVYAYISIDCSNSEGACQINGDIVRKIYRVLANATLPTQP